ncbi:MAG: superoxide dismutase [Candidatus Brocadiae bacterium]|nr:superoxide dismutase [Candidatus Brocadiia bacterium]
MDDLGLSRRHFLAAAGATAALGLARPLATLGEDLRAADSFILTPLPYPVEALEPAIDRETMTIHHGKHHAGYVANLNKAVAGTPHARKKIEELLTTLAELPAEIQGQVRNNGGGHHNHMLFWTGMKGGGGGEPTGKLADAIKSTFAGFDAFKTAFAEKAMKQFGSGWAWLVAREGKLELMSLPNQDSPLTIGATPILGLDVWEHAYYLKYQNRRADYVNAWWSVVDWTTVGSRFGS